MSKLTKIEPVIPSMPKRKRVAAYARVSLSTDELKHSLSTQISYYSSLIQSNPEWEYAGVYADEGITGTSTANRDEFNRLMADCDAGKVNIILVKSISRFARNTVDCLNAVRHLKDIGVEVRFEREKISTMSGDGELLLSLLASFAQEESESISANEKWQIKNKFERGESSTSLRCFGYDWDSETGACVVKEDEAFWVRYIFKRYLEGASLRGIAKELTEQGVKTLRGNDFAQNSVRGILQNELYVGDVRLQKTFSPQVRKHKTNRGEMPQYLVSNAHEAIISREDFQRAQEILEQRAAESNHGFTPHRFSGKIICGKCGHACFHFGSKKDESSVIQCGHRVQCGQRVKRNCDLLPIRETEFAEAWDKVTTKRDEPEGAVLYDDRIEFKMKSGTTKTIPRDFPSGRYDCFSGKVVCSKCGRTFSLVKNPHTKRIWRSCRKRVAPDDICDVQRLYEDELIEATKSVFSERDRDRAKSVFAERDCDRTEMDCTEMVRAEGDRVQTTDGDHIFADGRPLDCDHTLNDAHSADYNYKIRFYEDIDRVLVYDDRLDFVFKEGDIRTWKRQSQ